MARFRRAYEWQPGDRVRLDISEDRAFPGKVLSTSEGRVVVEIELPDESAVLTFVPDSTDMSLFPRAGSR